MNNELWMKFLFWISFFSGFQFQLNRVARKASRQWGNFSIAIALSLSAAAALLQASIKFNILSLCCCCYSAAAVCVCCWCSAHALGIKRNLCNLDTYGINRHQKRIHDLYVHPKNEEHKMYLQMKSSVKFPGKRGIYPQLLFLTDAALKCIVLNHLLLPYLFVSGIVRLPRIKEIINIEN